MFYVLFPAWAKVKLLKLLSSPLPVCLVSARNPQNLPGVFGHSKHFKLWQILALSRRIPLPLNTNVEGNGEPSVTPVSNKPIVNKMVMPWCRGVPWVPTFSGEDSKVKFQEWLWQITAMLRAQGLSEERKADFVIEALESQNVSLAARSKS